MNSLHSLLLIFFCLICQSLVHALNNSDSNHNLQQENDGVFYHSKRVNQMIDFEETNSWLKNKISEENFASLSAFEHFVYAFGYPEQYTQSCSLLATMQSYEKQLVSILPEVGEGMTMSQRQLGSLKENRDSTLLLISQSMSQGKVNDAYYRILAELNATESIPNVVDFIHSADAYNKSTALTLLCTLMKDSYGPFIQSEVHQGLYEITSEFESEFRKSIRLNQAVQDELIQLSLEYHEWTLSGLSSYVFIEEGHYEIGQEGHYLNPKRKTVVGSFVISKTEVTNEQFQKFVAATNYLSEAERNHNALVFREGMKEFDWVLDTTAHWRYPNGVEFGGIQDKMNHPVTCICFYDAVAYCEWANVRLPTIEEWEIASRAESGNESHYFGNNLNELRWNANIWEGESHLSFGVQDEFKFTSPVGSFKENPFGLFDVYGNVFEFCSNAPRGASSEIACTRVGSWWCSFKSCSFFNSIDIGQVRKEASFSNNGFRVGK